MMVILMEELKIKGVYKHFKGDYYLVEDIAISSEDNKTVFVVYRQLYGDGHLYIRELGEFLSDVDRKKYPDVKQKKRFELQEIKSVKAK